MKKKIGKLIEICSSQNYSDTKHLRTENGRGSTTDKQLAVHHLIETSVPFKLHFLENDLRTDPERYWKATKQLLDYWINNANENENIFPVSATDQQDFFMRNWFFNISETTKTIGNLILQADHPEKLLAPSLSAIHRNFNPFLVNLWSPHQIGQVPCPTSLHIQIHIPDDGSRPRFVQPYITDQTQFESTKEFWDNTDFYKADLTSWVDMERSNRKLISDQIRKYAWQSAEQIEIFLTDLENLWHRRTETFDGSHTRAFINHIEFVKKEKPNTGRRRSLGSLLDERIFNEEITSILHNTADAYAPWLEGELERIYRDNPLLEESRRPIGE